MLLSSSELLGLRWCDVNFGENGIDVSHQLSRASGKKPAELLPLKTDAAERIIDLAPALASVLLERKLTTGHSRNEDFVFCSEIGLPLYYRNVTRRGLEKAANASRVSLVRLAVHRVGQTSRF